MGKGIEIGVASETKAFKMGVETGIIKPLEDAVDALDDLGKAKGPEQLEKGFKEAQTASDRLQKQTKKIADNIEDDFRDAYRGMAREATTATRKAGDGFDDLKRESQQSLRETAASIKDVNDGLDAVQEIAANAFVGFGPAGMAAGITAAAGLGLVSEGIRTANEDADRLKETLIDAYKSAAEEGRIFLDEAQVQAGVLNTVFDPTALKNAREEAALIGVDVMTYIRGQNGDLAALNTTIEAGNDAQQKRVDLLREANDSARGGQGIGDHTYQTMVKINAENEALLVLHEQQQAAASLITAGQQENLELIQKQNKAMADTPKTVPTKLVVDDSDLTNALARSRTVRINLEGYAARNGVRIV